MKKLQLAIVFLFIGGAIFSQSPEEMKAWEASMTPGPQHELLASMNGDWNAKVKLWMDPSQPPTESDATTKNEMVMNGLYQRSTHTGTMMGMPFQGEAITGYDNPKKKFVSTWIDNMGSGIMMMEGNYDEKSKSMILIGTMTDPMTGNDMKVKEVMTLNSADKHTFEMFMMMDGSEMKTMEIVYTRMKD